MKTHQKLGLEIKPDDRYNILGGGEIDFSKGINNISFNIVANFSKFYGRTRIVTLILSAAILTIQNIRNWT